MSTSGEKANQLSDLEKFKKLESLSHWNTQKQIIATTRKNTPTVKVGEIRWAAIGENIGSEINGKGEKFTRPVYVFKTNGSTTFIGIPTSHGATKEKDRLVEITVDNQSTNLVLSQIQCISTLRVYGRIAILDKQTIAIINHSLHDYLFPK